MTFGKYLICLILSANPVTRILLQARWLIACDVIEAGILFVVMFICMIYVMYNVYMHDIYMIYYAYTHDTVNSIRFSGITVS